MLDYYYQRQMLLRLNTQAQAEYPDHVPGGYVHINAREVTCNTAGTAYEDDAYNTVLGIYDNNVIYKCL